MQTTGREKGGGNKSSASRLLYRGNTILILSDLIDGIQIPLIAFRVGKKVSGTKKFGSFFFFWTHLMKCGQFDLLN